MIICGLIVTWIFKYKILKIFYKNGEDVGMAQKLQKQEMILQSKALAVHESYKQGCCNISLHLAALASH